jgi:hypothetical protein
MGAAPGDNTGQGGILIYGDSTQGINETQRRFQDYAERLGLGQHVEMDAGADGVRRSLRFRLRQKTAQAWAPQCDTMQLCEKLQLDTIHSDADLEREILIAMLLGPVAFEFPSHDELESAVRIRQNIVEAARRTALSFHTSEAERPAEFWRYAEGRGFTLLPEKSLMEALRKATQPDLSGMLYSFSCYRATEYVTLLGLAQELINCNPELFASLQTLWQSRAIMSGEFHEVFLREHGTMSKPLPLKYFVPGDRTWFRNPDAHSSDVTGYEGSWVMYLGGGLFNNFWKRDQPYTLLSKCVEMYHWRHATYRDRAGELQIDEAIVEERVRASLADPAQIDRILAIMLRHREPGGVYVDGGCIDTTREHLRWVCPGTADLVLPER